MKDIVIGDYVLQLFQNEYGNLYGKVFDKEGNKINEMGTIDKSGLSQKWIWMVYVEPTEENIEEEFVVWLYNLGKLPKTHKKFKLYEG